MQLIDNHQLVYFIHYGIVEKIQVFDENLQGQTRGSAAYLSLGFNILQNSKSCVSFLQPK